MQTHIRLGRIAGISIGLHYSWFIIALLITLSLAARFQAVNSEWGTATIWASATVAAILFFASLVAHELSHALMARHHGLEVRAITLFALGGMAQIGQDSRTASTEFQVAVVGPLTSLAIGGALVASGLALGWSAAEGAASPTVAIIGWLGFINIALAVFNLLPGFPLDGGRVLKAAIWGLTDDAARATRWAARTGQAVAFAFILLGLAQFMGGAGIGGLWLALIGWFLLEVARNQIAQADISQRLEGVTVADVMSDHYRTLDADASIDTFATGILERPEGPVGIVQQDGRPVGIVTPREVRQIPSDEWASTPLERVMQPIEELRTVAPTTSAEDALEAMARAKVVQLPVIADGRLQGIVESHAIMRLFAARQELSHA